MDDGRVPEADMHGGRAGNALQRPVQHRDAVRTCLLRPGLQVGLVQLDDVGSGFEQVPDLVVDRLRVAEGGRLPARVVVVLRLLGHRERARHGDLDRAVGVRPEELQVGHLDRVTAPDRPDDPRHRIGVPAAVKRGARVVDVHAFQRGREPVGVALPAHLAVGDDVKSRVLLGPDREHRRVVLGLAEKLGRHAPQLAGADPGRKPPGQLGPVDKPVRLWITSDERRGQQHGMQVTPEDP